MRSGILLIGAVLAGVVVGAVLMLSLQQTSAEEFESATTAAVDPSEGERATTTSSEVAKGPPPVSDKVLLVWTPGGLPEGFADAVASLDKVTGVTTVSSDLVHMTRSLADGEVVDEPRAGFVIPIETMAFDPDTYMPFITSKDITIFSSLEDGEVLLGNTSARVRRLDVGATVEVDSGVVLTVAGVVDDVLIGGAEFAVQSSDAEALGVLTQRYLLVRHQATRADIEKEVTVLLDGDLAVRIRAPGETPILRHGDAVLPQAMIKEQFGEFAYKPDDSGRFEIEPTWVSENIVTEEVPLLGRVTCHRNLIPALTGAMAELSKANLSFLIFKEDFAGCFNPRYIANRRDISRHSWGAALDINMGSNPRGVESAQDARLVGVMERWGFTSGHDWLIPDPGHFEFLTPPS